MSVCFLALICPLNLVVIVQEWESHEMRMITKTYTGKDFMLGICGVELFTWQPHKTSISISVDLITCCLYLSVCLSFIPVVLAELFPI